MKSILLLSLATVLLAGCHSSYVITLNSGTKLSSLGKPKLVGGMYFYKDANGQDVQISSSRIKSIERR